MYCGVLHQTSSYIAELRYFLCHLLGDDPKCDLESMQQKKSSPEVFFKFSSQKASFLGSCTTLMGAVATCHSVSRC